MLLHEQGLDDIVVDKLRLDVPPADLSRVAPGRRGARRNPDTTVTIAMVGKYVNLRDSYISLSEALIARRRAHAHARQHPVRRGDRRREARHGLPRRRRRDPRARRLRRARHRRQDPGDPLRARAPASRTSASASACSSRSSSTRATSRACDGAHSTEFNRASPHPVIALITEWQDREGHGRAAHREIRTRRHDAARRAGSAAVARLARAPDLRLGRDHGAPSPSLRVQQPLPAEADERGPALLRLLARRAGRDDRAADASVLRREPVPSGVPLDAARRPSAVHGLRQGGARVPPAAADAAVRGRDGAARRAS